MLYEHMHLLSFPSKLQFSDEELFEFCMKNQEINIERDSEMNLIIWPLSGALASTWNVTVASQLTLWNLKANTGVVFPAFTGFIFPNKSMRSPDTSWLSNGQWNKLSKKQKEQFAPVCPEFVVEIMSPFEDWEHLQTKMDEYIANGVKLGWLFDVQNETVFIYTSNGKTESVKGFNQTIKADNTLPGFELDLSLFKQ